MGDTRIVAVKLPSDIYEELARRARRRGYSLVSDYVRDIILRELGYSETDLEALVRRVVDERLREAGGAGGGVSREALQKLVTQLERRLQDMINPWTAKIDSLSTRLADVIERLETLEERVSKLEEQLREQKAAAETPGPAPRVATSFHRGSHGAQPRQRRKTAIERLREQGVVFEHEVQWLRDRDAFFERLEREGAIVMELGGERVAVDPGFWENFKEKLQQLPTANDEEVKILLTQPQYELFKRLKEQGIIYFDTSSKSWKFVEDPTKGART